MSHAAVRVQIPRTPTRACRTPAPLSSRSACARLISSGHPHAPGPETHGKPAAPRAAHPLLSASRSGVRQIRRGPRPHHLRQRSRESPQPAPERRRAASAPAASLQMADGNGRCAFAQRLENRRSTTMTTSAASRGRVHCARRTPRTGHAIPDRIAASPTRSCPRASKMLSTVSRSAPAGSSRQSTTQRPVQRNHCAGGNFHARPAQTASR